MPRAVSILPSRFDDGRHECFERGLKALGYTLVEGYREPESPDDVLLTWTRHRGAKHNQATTFERAGGRVIVFEEGHLKPPLVREKVFSACLRDHNGAGIWKHGGDDRWRRFGIPIPPWRRHSRRILIREQRSIGSPSMASPPDWHLKTARHLQTMANGFDIAIRRHPKIVKQRGLRQESLEEAMADCRCLVTWGSADGSMALLHGVPVVLLGPHGFVEDACGRTHEAAVAPNPAPLAIEGDPADDDEWAQRLDAFDAFAWSQWALAECETGEAFDGLLRGTTHDDYRNRFGAV